MASFRRDPYLWVHFAGLAALPLFLDICLLGLAAGYPIFPVWLEMALLIAIGVGPVLWMQWQRPFYIFSLLVVAVKPDRLTDEQRRILQLFRSPQVKLLTGIAAVVWAWVLWQIYQIAPIAANVTPFTRHATGLGVAAVASLGGSLFLQVPLSVLRVLWVSEQKLATVEPYPKTAIAQDFTLLGLQLNQVLPELELELKAEKSADAKLSFEESAIASKAGGVKPKAEKEVSAEGGGLNMDKAVPEAGETAATAAENTVVLSPSEGQAEVEAVAMPPADSKIDTQPDTEAGTTADAADSVDNSLAATPESSVILSPSEGQGEAEIVSVAETDETGAAQDSEIASSETALADSGPVECGPVESGEVLPVAGSETAETASAESAAGGSEAGVES